MKKPELNITRVQVSEYRSGIPLQGWESVETALNTFAAGRSRKSRATQDDLTENIGRDHGVIGIFLLASAGVDRNRFVQEMLQGAKPSVTQGSGRWSRHYDYDAMGTSFFKTSVDLTKLPNTDEGYLLGLNAAYVGKEVEDGLAETLGVEQGLQWKSVDVKLAPEGTNFRVDFDAVADRLRRLYEELDPVPTPEPEPRGFRQRLIEAVRREQPTEKPALTGEAIVRTLLATDEYTSGSNPFVLGIKDGIVVSLNLGRVGDRFNWRNGNKSEELWQAEGSVLSGPLAESYSKKGQLRSTFFNSKH